MIVETKRFGSLEIEEKDIIEIAGGLLGFEGVEKYVLLDHEHNTPFKWLQAVEKPELAFVVMEPFIFCPDYQFELSENDVKTLDLSKPEDAGVLSVLVVPDDPKKMSANLKAPIIINRNNRRGRQVILTNEKYPIKFYLFQEKHDVPIGKEKQKNKKVQEEKKCQGGL